MAQIGGSLSGGAIGGVVLSVQCFTQNQTTNPSQIFFYLLFKVFLHLHKFTKILADLLQVLVFHPSIYFTAENRYKDLQIILQLSIVCFF
jgi:hypothetical protein